MKNKTVVSILLIIGIVLVANLISQQLFFRLDEARNLDASGTGLGLAIARDIARGHGGDVTLSDSPMGGLRATVRVPV